MRPPIYRTVAGHSDDTLKDCRGSGPDGVIALQPYLFVALEADRPLAGGARYGVAEVDEIVVGRGSEREVSCSDSDGIRRLLLRLPGRSLSGIHARLWRASDGWHVEDKGSTNGTFVNGQRTERARLGGDEVVEVGHSFLLLRDLPDRIDRAATDLDSRALYTLPAGFATLIPRIADELVALERIARSGVTVTLRGETGTGKELLARAIHGLSGRPGPFLAVNCGALTDSLAESQLFGHVRGAFTGAVADAPGYLRAANGGTLLLDEVGDLGRTAQVALLRALQEQEVVPVGSARSLKIDVRFVATTPRPLEELVQSGQFRSDLYARLSGFTHTTPPLRNRIEDVGLLVAALLTKMGVRDTDAPMISPELGLGLLRHSWPLNVRELEQSLGRGWALAAGGVMDLAHMRLASADPGPGAPADRETESSREVILSAEDRDLRDRIVQALAATHGNVAEVARRLGKARMQLHRWMRRFAIDPRSFRD
jgi:DNA-binding NtrC family response regulator